MATWVITEDDGRWTVTRGRTRKPFDSEDDALAYVRRQRKPGERLLREETDGYRTPLRPRRHWRGRRNQ